MNALTWLFFFAVVVGFLTWIVAGIIRIGNRKAAESKKLEARKAEEAGKYRAYLAEASDPRD